MENVAKRKMEDVAEGLNQVLNEYRKGPYNVLVPSATIQEISPFHKPVLEIVRINPNKDAGEVYEIVQGSGDFSLRAVALQKIGYAAGLIWNARGCGRTDDSSNPNIISYRAEAAVRKEDGTYMPLSAEYMLDLEVIEQETRDSYEKKSQTLMQDKRKKGEKWTEEDRKNYVEKSLRRDMLQKRKFRLQLAQTGAMDIVIRKILGLKGTYKREELEKPFVVPKIAFNPDVSDPKVRELLLKQGLDATNILFGPPSEKTVIDYQPAATEQGRMIDVTPPAEAEKIETESEETPHTEEPEKPFDKLDAKGQKDVLKKLMVKKGYIESKLKKSLDNFTEDDRKKFFDHLNKMADVEDLPFE